MLRETRKQQTKVLIVQQAITLFKQKGYENVTVEEITTACGIAKGTFFNYFGKKEQLLLHIMNSYMDVFEKIVQQNQQVHLKERIVHIFHDLLTIYQKYHSLLQLTLEETIRAEIRATIKSSNITRFQAALTTIINEAKENGSVRLKWKTNACASIIVGVFINTFINQASSLSKEKTMEVFQQQLDIVWEGIADESMEENLKK